MIVARRYARALMEEAKRQSKLRAVDEDVEFMQASLQSSRELDTFFRSPIITRQKKSAVIRELIGSHVDSLTLQFLILMVEKEREDLLADILSAYRTMRDEEEGVVDATARVAMSLDEAERTKLVSALEDVTGRTIRLTVREQPDLIGGIVIRLGDMVYDGSVSRQLERLRNRMEEGSYLLN